MLAFPIELTNEIFSHLDLHSIIQYSSVCKAANEQTNAFFEDIAQRIGFAYENSCSLHLKNLALQIDKSSKPAGERLITLLKSPCGSNKIPAAHLAILSLRNLDSLKICITIFKRKLEAPHFAGYTLLHTAAFNGRIEIIPNLLHNEWNALEKTSKGSTVITLAQQGYSSHKSAIISLLSISLTEKTRIN